MFSPQEIHYIYWEYIGELVGMTHLYIQHSKLVRDIVGNKSLINVPHYLWGPYIFIQHIKVQMSTK